MRITSIGGGPGGLYAAILLKRAHPEYDITVLERNAPSDTFGWGVVFSTATLAELDDADAETYTRIINACARWDPVDIWYRGEVIRARGNSFAAISRKLLLNILQERCRELGVRLMFRTEVEDPAAQRDADLVLGADGINSRTRARFAEAFQPRLTVQGGKFIWLGTTKRFDAFTFIFKEGEHGVFQVHAYPFDQHTSTFIVECDERSWRNARMDRYEEAPLPPGESDLESIAYCQELFAEELGGHELLPNNSKWLDWVTVENKTWRHENVVLLGDAAHTAHFSIGSGTKLAMEDAIALARALELHPSLDAALADYESERRLAVQRTQEAAEESLEWFTRYHRYLHFAPPQFAYSLLTRSKRVTYDNLRIRDPQLVGALERWFTARAADGKRGLPVVAAPPALTRVRLGDLELANRIVVAAEQDDQAQDGAPSPAQLARFAELGAGGAGLLLVELAAVAPDARITPGSIGLYAPAHVSAWRDLVDAVHAGGGTRVGIQFVHAGRRGATRPRRHGSDLPLGDGAWPLVAPSPLPYRAISQVPRALDAEGMRTVIDDHVRAAELALQAGFDALEVHAGHGYLLGSFLSPLTNRREDEYGGALEGRLRFPLEVVRAVRAVWPEGRPLSVCLGASDLEPGGLSPEDAVEAARQLAAAGVDYLSVVAGQTTPGFRPEYETGFYAPWSDLVRNTARVPTLASGAIRTLSDANHLILAGRADLCLLGRPLPAPPAWLERCLPDGA